MAIYSAGRRRTMVILLLTSVLFITLDLRGNAVFNAARSGFEYALRPFEIAGEVIARPISRAWRGITEVDDLEDEVNRLQELVDQQRASQIAGDNAIIENRELRAQIGLESLASISRVTGQVIGQSPSNFDQRVEIDIGLVDGIRVGMPVMSPAGLVGKITNAFPETSIVMLVTDPQYHTQVKVVGEISGDVTTTVPDTVPSGLPIDDVTTTTATTTTTTTTTVPGEVLVGPSTTILYTADGEPVVITDLDTVGNVVTPAEPVDGVTTTAATTSTSTTTTTVPAFVRETGVLDGYGAGVLPRVRFIADSSQFGRPEIGDAILTSGGSDSLAPPDIPVGRVINIISKPGTGGLELEVDLNADLDRLNFLTVLLYRPPIEAPGIGG